MVRHDVEAPRHLPEASRSNHSSFFLSTIALDCFGQGSERVVFYGLSGTTRARAVGIAFRLTTPDRTSICAYTTEYNLRGPSFPHIQVFYLHPSCPPTRTASDTTHAISSYKTCEACPLGGVPPARRANYRSSTWVTTAKTTDRIGQVMA